MHAFPWDTVCSMGSPQELPPSSTAPPASLTGVLLLPRDPGSFQPHPLNLFSSPLESSPSAQDRIPCFPTRWFPGIPGSNLCQQLGALRCLLTLTPHRLFNLMFPLVFLKFLSFFIHFLSFLFLPSFSEAALHP